MSNSDSDIKDTTYDFGAVLAEARKSQNYTLEEIYTYLKIPVQTISAIEASDVDLLPEPTFTKGYIRVYAKFLEIPEENLLDLYNRAVPQGRAEKIKSRSNLPNQKNSQSPLIKIVTVMLIVAAIAAVIYGGYQYYQKKASVMENELESKERSFTGNSLDSPGLNPVNIEQNADLAGEDELIVQQSDPLESEQPVSVREEPDIDDYDLVDPDPESETDVLTESKAETPGEVKVDELTSSSTPSESDQMADGPLDELTIYAKNGAWMQVHDANNVRLLYNMVPVRGSKVIQGRAPFHISLGNAKSTSLLINDLAIDMTDYIRANNTASFTVSTNHQAVIFH
jgi:cytoskeleton protein RodZ